MFREIEENELINIIEGEKDDLWNRVGKEVVDKVISALTNNDENSSVGHVNYCPGNKNC